MIEDEYAIIIWDDFQKYNYDVFKNLLQIYERLSLPRYIVTGSNS